MMTPESIDTMLLACAPCPFCGGEHLRVCEDWMSYRHLVSISCNICSANSGRGPESEAVSRWNAANREKRPCPLCDSPTPNAYGEADLFEPDSGGAFNDIAWPCCACKNMALPLKDGPCTDCRHYAT